MDLERELFRNYGPWLEPLTPGAAPEIPAPPRPPGELGGGQGNDRQPSGWDNRWYYRGW